MNKKQIVEVPYRPYSLEPNRCFVDVVNIVTEFGGRPVYGWWVSEQPYHYELVHHCCWRDTDNMLWNISPQFNFETMCIVGEPIQFLLDPKAKYTGQVLTNRYQPKTQNKHIREGCRCLALSNIAYYHQRDWELGTRWTQLATAAYRRAGVPATFDPIPIELMEKWGRRPNNDNYCNQ